MHDSPSPAASRTSRAALGARTARSSGIGLALVSALAFGGSGTAAKPLISAGIAPFDMVWLRITGAALVLLPIAVRHRRAVRQRPWLLLGFGLTGVAGVQACYFSAISRIPIGVAMLLEYLAPPLILGYIRFVQRRPVSRAAALGALLAVVGLAFVVEIWSGLGGLSPVGMLLGIGAACCQIGYFMISDAGGGAPGGSDRPSSREPVEPLAVTAWGLVVGALVMTVLARPWGLPWQVLGHQVAMNGHQVPAALLLAWVVLVATVLAYLTGITSVRLLSPAVAGVVACLEAVVAAVAAWVLLGERLSGSQVFGGALVLFGAFVAQTAGSGGRRSGEPGPPALDVLPGAGEAALVAEPDPRG